MDEVKVEPEADSQGCTQVTISKLPLCDYYSVIRALAYMQKHGVGHERERAKELIRSLTVLGL